MYLVYFLFISKHDCFIILVIHYIMSIIIRLCILVRYFQYSCGSRFILGEFLLLLYVGVEATMTLVGGLDPPRDRRFVAEQHKTPPPPTYVQG